MKKSRVGLAVGCLFAVIHAVWSLAVAAIPDNLQTFINWVLNLHHIDLPITITAFNLTNAVILVIIAFIYGYIIGWVFAWLWNWLIKK